MPKTHVLQRGRGHLTAESSRPHGIALDTGRLQRGRGHLTAESEKTEAFIHEAFRFNGAAVI